jgi:hypothetical protein
LHGRYEEIAPEELAGEVDIPLTRDNPLVSHQEKRSNDSLAV